MKNLQRDRLILTCVLILSSGITLPTAARAQSAGRQVAITPVVETLLSGSDWKLGSFPMEAGDAKGAYRYDFDDRAWPQVRVPGEVQLQTGLEGMDLYYQSKQLTLINGKEWWYRKRFVVPKAEAGKLLRLVFEGVDYFATVWLNGEKLGDHEGCYIPFSYDVSSKIKFGEENLVVVKVTCPWVPKGRGFLEYMKGEWTLISPGNIMHFPAPPYILGPYWDGIPAAGNAAFPMGLFRDVKLVASGSAVIDDLFVTTRSLHPDGSATLRVSATVRNYGNHDIAATLDLRLSPDNFIGDTLALPGRKVQLHPGEDAFSQEVQVTKAALWWTWDLGAQNLYKLTASIAPDGGGSATARSTLFGIRTIARNSDMSYWLNGRRMFLKGAWYPMGDYFGSRPTRQTYERDLELFKSANMNYLVAFTVVEKPDFYELCDRMGILEMYEFPFEQFGPLEVLAYSNPRRETYVRESLSQVRQVIVQLRNHPSIVLWAAFAEAHEKGKGWGAAGEDWDQYGYQEYSDQIGKLVEELAPGTIYHPSLCDVGENHFWAGAAGIGVGGNYLEHFNADTGMVSEYGSIALPAFETLQKILKPEEMWSSENSSLPRWHNVPMDVPAYAYQTSFEYNGLSSVLYRVNMFVDRHIRSVREFIDDSQLYQAFIFKYATECYRRKKYHSINGTRIWAFGEVTPGIRFNFLDYYRVPKMGYYYLKNAHARFAVNFAYEEALESQVSGTHLRIPVWVVNDYRREIPFDLHCEIFDLNGRPLWTRDFAGSIESDGAKPVATVEWTTPDTPGIYLLRARATSRGGEQLSAETSTFIKVTPRLFARPVRVLLIGERQYSFPIAAMVRGMGIHVDVIEEKSIPQLAVLKNPDELRKQYDVVWLACFDSLWKLLNEEMAEGLKQAVHQGMGFIHTGGPGSFHGGFGRAALLEFRSLSEILPVNLRSGNDVIFGQLDRPTGPLTQSFSPLRDIATTPSEGERWPASGLQEFGVAGFNDVDLKPGARQHMTISGRPLLATGRFGQGTTVAFAGFTPSHLDVNSFWDPKVILPYAVDQQFVTDPVTRSYFGLFMRMIAEAVGQKPATPFEELLSSKDKPLFESLQDLPPTTLSVPPAVKAELGGKRISANFFVANGPHYARLVRVRAEWPDETQESPCWVKYSDNYFDLLPEEKKKLDLEVFVLKKDAAQIAGTLIVEGPNVETKRIPIVLNTP